MDQHAPATQKRPANTDDTLVYLTREITDLRFEIERRIGRILATANYHVRRIEREQKAEQRRASRGER